MLCNPKDKPDIIQRPADGNSTKARLTGAPRRTSFLNVYLYHSEN